MTGNKTIATAGIITVAVGSTNAIANHKTLPSTKFLLGSGVAYLILSVLADAGMEELAQALSIAIMTTVILGEGNGVLSWIDGKGEVDTQKKPKTATAPPRPNDAKNTTSGSTSDQASARNVVNVPIATTPYPGLN